MLRSRGMKDLNRKALTLEKVLARSLISVIDPTTSPWKLMKLFH